MSHEGISFLSAGIAAGSATTSLIKYLTGNTPPHVTIPKYTLPPALVTSYLGYLAHDHQTSLSWAARGHFFFTGMAAGALLHIPAMGISDYEHMNGTDVIIPTTIAALSCLGAKKCFTLKESL